MKWEYACIDIVLADGRRIYGGRLYQPKPHAVPSFPTATLHLPKSVLDSGRGK